MPGTAGKLKIPLKIVEKKPKSLVETLGAVEKPKFASSSAENS